MLIIEPSEQTIEADIDNLLLSPVPKEPVPEPAVEEPPSRANSQSPVIQPPTGINYFPYVLAVQCWIGGRFDHPTPSDSDIITAQINTSVHASFINAALVHSLGLSHKIRNRRPPRHNQSYRYQPTPRPRILLPVCFPTDSSQPSESNSQKCQIDFVVVSTHEVDHQKLIPLEIGSQALFLHGVDIMFSTRTIRIAGVNIPIPQIAPRDQKRLLSSFILAPFAPAFRRNPKHDEISVGGGPWEEDPSLLRDTSTNSSISSTSIASQSTTAGVTSPSLTEVDVSTTSKGEEDASGLLTPPPTAGVFASALQFIPSSVLAKPKDDSRSRSATLEEKKDVPVERTLSPSNQDNSLLRSNTVHDDSRSKRSSTQEGSSSAMQSPIEIAPKSPSLPEVSPRNIPPRESSLQQFPSPQSEIPSTSLDEEIMHIPPALMDRIIQRKASSTWPRSLGKKVAPWTSADTTKTTILSSTTWDESNPSVPPRKMKVLKAVRSQHPLPVEQEKPLCLQDNAELLKGGGEGLELKTDVVRDTLRTDGKAENEEHKSPIVVAKNVGGGAFHWMK